MSLLRGRGWPLLSAAASLVSLAYSFWLYSTLPDRWLRWMMTLLSKPDRESPPFDLIEWVDRDLSLFFLAQALLLIAAMAGGLLSRNAWAKLMCVLIVVGALASSIYVVDFALAIRADLALSEGYRFSLLALPLRRRFRGFPW